MTQSSTDKQSPADEQVALRREADEARRELADTVGALAAKTDVKARTRRKANELTGQTRDRARDLAGRSRAAVRERPGGAVAAGVTAAVVVAGAVVVAKRRGGVR